MTSHVCLQSTLSDSNIESIGQKCLENTPKFFFLNNLLQIIMYKLYFYCFFRGEKQSWFFLRIAKIADKICLTSISGFDEEMFLYSIQLFILFFITSLSYIRTISRLIWGRCNLKRSRRTVIFLPVYKISSLKITPPKTPNSGQFSYPLPNIVSFLFEKKNRLEFRLRSREFSFLLLPFNGHRQLVDYSATFWVCALKLEHT